ncbi:hypothetical protein N7499_004194 [Penicillium canescens]|nr:uncharacterized protein N7446_011790 [Penicillium canescens]XP_058373539.1 uncharacterized protein N7446_007616 [Penicillium canescens]XP_058373540.1 uncharacterized protein N7446_003462 [Penicillium canescens]KAJ6028871.1 hypothetical protein N7444_011858 [Penicillium canescens]KAJ6037839.1 hypothetical protein N7444_010544 [Penicillium canescens]KAJ6049107.1 hypothetical protein N7446_011790 [Penicillium canescens]KAJ6063496.1 hypothetical protein N7446_007616 [Penicillium canescens]KAJ
MLRLNGDPGVRRAARDARMGIIHLGITVPIIGLGRLPIGVTLITPLLDEPELPVVVAALLAGISIDLPIQITIQHRSTTLMITGHVLPD